MRTFGAALLVVIAVASFARGDEVDPVLELERALGSRDPLARKAAVEEVAPVHSKAVSEALGKVLRRDVSPIVRKAAARALGTQGTQAASVVLAEAAAHEDADVEVVLEVVQALGQTETDTAALALLPLLRTRPQVYRYGKTQLKSDETLRVTQAALEALARIGSARAADGIIEFGKIELPTFGNSIKKDHLAASDPILKKVDAALQAVTGEHREGVSSWVEWRSREAASTKVICVYRCERTGRNYERSSLKNTACPEHGSSCGFLLKTRYEKGGLPPAPAPAKKAKKK